LRRLFLLASLVAALPKRVRGQDAVPSSMVAAGARILAQMIQTARAKVIAGGVKPVPIGVHRGLLGYFPDSLLRKARFAAGQDDGAALPALAFGYGHAAAVTLGEVVVFRDPRAAETDLKLWAHELTHVLQYQRWGIDGFAERYVSGRESVEKEAYDNADRFAAWRAR
jgi:Domain of unknown function (DUF4157)